MSVPEHSGSLRLNPATSEILRAAGIWAWETDLETETTAYEQGFWEQYGYDAALLAETFDFLSVVHTGDLRTVAAAWRAHLEAETQLYECQWRLRTAAGSWRWIQARGKVTSRHADGRPLRMVGVYTDITELRQSELDLAESNAELDAVFRSSRDGLAVIAPDLTLLRANEAAIALVRKFATYDLEEGESLLHVPTFHADRPVMMDIERALAGDAQVPSRTLNARTGAGWWEFSYSPVRDPDSAILGVAVTVRDVTEKVRLEQARAQALRLESMGLMAGGIAHDFNNLLGAIIGNVELAALAVADPGARSGLDDALQAARRAAGLVQQLLVFAGRHEPVVRPVDVSELAGEIARYAGKIPGRKVGIRTDLPTGLPKVEADATQLHQLVLNLIVNALDAAREHGSGITVRTSLVRDPAEMAEDLVIVQRPAPGYIALEVADDGAGMDAETRTRIFDPFFTTKPDGHGLGLASVLGAVRGHGGALAVQSEPGAGATFTVFLPVSAAPGLTNA